MNDEKHIPPQWWYMNDVVFNFVDMNTAVGNLRTHPSPTTRRQAKSNLISFYMKVRVKVLAQQKKHVADNPEADPQKVGHAWLIQKMDNVMQYGEPMNDQDIFAVAIGLGEFFETTGATKVETYNTPLAATEAIKGKFRR